jgi:hypothetical protein
VMEAVAGRAASVAETEVVVVYRSACERDGGGGGEQ